MKILSHKRLGISFAELGAFLGTYAMLKNKVLKHDRKREVQSDKHIFNMASPGRNGECGTVGCIGANMAFIMGMEEYETQEYVSSSKGRLHQLFYPPGRYDYRSIPITKTLKAMENFAATGHAKWQEVLGNKYK